jgi:type II secretory pathway component GspD/PulD (secretin)
MKINISTFTVAVLLTAPGFPAAAQTNTNSSDTNAGAIVLPTNGPNTNSAAANVVPLQGSAHPGMHEAAAMDAPEITPTNEVRMSFRDVPLQTVLTYLSARMGFVINSDVDIRGDATIVSEQPVGTNDVLKLLSAALAKNNYSVTQDGRILNITTADNAKTGASTPVRQANKPDEIPVNDQIATYILPVHTLNPTQLIKDLDQLIPSGATVAANEAGNALIMTARQKDIHRFSEIISALDGSSVSEVEVKVMKYADAKSVADELKEIFQSPDSTVARADRPRFSSRFGGGFPFGGGGGESGNSTDQKNAANKAVFTSDDQMNAVIASAPPDYFPMITNVWEQLDQPSEDITMMKVFHLKFADAQETADELTSMFSDDTTKTDQNSRSMGYRFTPPWMQPQTPASNKSQRMTRQTTVRAVPDLRTESVIVTASKDMMEQIAGVVQELDENPRGKQSLISFDIDHADPVAVQAAFTALFAGPNTKSSTSTQNQSVLQSRAQADAQQQSSTTTTGSTGLGGTSGVR